MSSAAAFIPCGFHFVPTEEEIISLLMAFLEFRAKGKPFPSSPVAEKVLYGDNATPWNVFREDDAWEITETESGGKKGVIGVVYAFTKLSAISAMSAKKKVRTAGCGTWHGQTGIKEIKNRRGQIIGSMKMLSYKANNGSSESHMETAQWRMHEYALSGVSLTEMKSKHIDIDNYVICKVTMDSTKCKRKPEFEEEIPNKKFRTSVELGNLEVQESDVNYSTSEPAAELAEEEDFVEFLNSSIEKENSEQEKLLAAAANNSYQLTASEAPKAEENMKWINSLIDLDSDIATLDFDIAGYTDAMESEFLALI